MALPLQPPIEPQLARGKPELPIGESWAYEPKYDGFRAIAFVDGDELLLQSRGSKPLERYFPELLFPAGRYVLDGEIVIDARPGASETEDFDALLQPHPPGRLADRAALGADARRATSPSTCWRSTMRRCSSEPFAERRRRLEQLALPGIALAPVGRPTAAAAEPWLRRLRASSPRT